MRTYLKTKPMRKLIKSYRLIEKRRMKMDGVYRKQQNKLCSECDPLNCICRANERSIELIRLFNSNKQIALTAI